MFCTFTDGRLVSGIACVLYSYSVTVFVIEPLLLCLLMSGQDSEAPPAVVTSLCYPELTVTVETMGSHVVWHPPCDLRTHI